MHYEALLAKKIAAACIKMQGQITSGANCIAQRATIKALEESPEKIQYMVCLLYTSDAADE